MMENIKDIEWHEPRIAIPAFVTMVIMPLTYSIAYGVLGGLATYIVLHLCLTAIDLVIALFSGGPLPACLLLRVRDSVHCMCC
jgi:xanthine/uracil/vitamin C permease (AzgA family)